MEKTLLQERKYKFGYFIINKRDLTDICIINNHSEWFDLYAEFSHQMIDPVVVRSLSRIEDFRWNKGITALSNKVMLQAKEYNINSGHTFILHDYKNNLVLLSIFNDMHIKKEPLLNKEKIFSLLVKTHQEILSLYENLEGNFKDSINITKRESEVLCLVSTGKTYKEVSMTTGIHVATVKFHMGNIVKKLGAVNARHAIKLASDLKLVIFPVEQKQ
nr:LuxR family transcriptional regulator [Winslowiella toletana]